MAPILQTQMEMIKNFHLQLQKICTPLGFDSLTVLAHACHETGNLERVIGENNYWGIKTPQYSKWTGLVAKAITHEYVNRKKIKVIATFRDWATPKESIEWYCNFIKNNYKKAYEQRTNAFEYFPALVKYQTKYATDPNYAAAAIERYKWLKKTFFQDKQ